MKLAIAPLLIICLASAALTVAEPKQRHSGKHKGPNIERLTERLQLTEEQVVDVEAILAEHHEAAVERRLLSREDRQQHRAATRERLAGVLSEDQLASFDEMREKRRSKHKRRQHRQNDTN